MLGGSLDATEADPEAAATQIEQLRSLFELGGRWGW
jgi:hypothetical protein